MSLTLTPLPDLPLVHPGDDLAEIILTALSTPAHPEGQRDAVSRAERAHIALQNGDILVLAQKIVSKAEGRLVNLETVTPSPQALDLAAKTEKDPRLVELILQESNEVLRTRPGLLVVEHKLGFVCANAGIDHSNVWGDWGQHKDWVLLLPENPDASAAALRERLESASNARIGVMIIDSHGRAWRLGTVGVCIGLSGLPGLVDLRGQADLFGYKLRVTEVGVADELAAAASLMMGQVTEGTPVVHVRGFPYPLRDAEIGELLRPKEKDMFR